MLTPLEVLICARKLIARPRWWTRGVCARDRFGVQVSPSSGGAYCWCAYGALIRAAGYGPLLSAAVVILERVIGSRMTLFNDGADHAEVLAKFDEAIALAKAEAA